METIKAIEERRSVRTYIKKDIDKEIILDILNCGRLAPSAKNRQPWYFVVVKNEMKDKIADMMLEYTLNSDFNIERKLLGHKSSISPTANAIKQAPVLILVFKEKADNWTIGDNLSIGACIENMCLRARELEIGSLWIRDTDCVEDDITGLFDLKKVELNSALLLGYTETFPKMRPRKNLEDIVKWYE